MNALLLPDGMISLRMTVWGKKSKSFCKSNNKDFKFESIKVSCLNKIGKKIFSKNPWIIVKNIQKTKNWIKYEKKKELSNLKE